MRNRKLIGWQILAGIAASLGSLLGHFMNGPLRAASLAIGILGIVAFLGLGFYIVREMENR